MSAEQEDPQPANGYPDEITVEYLRSLNGYQEEALEHADLTDRQRATYDESKAALAAESTAQLERVHQILKSSLNYGSMADRLTKRFKEKLPQEPEIEWDSISPLTDMMQPTLARMDPAALQELRAGREAQAQRDAAQEELARRMVDALESIDEHQKGAAREGRVTRWVAVFTLIVAVLTLIVTALVGAYDIASRVLG